MASRRATRIEDLNHFCIQFSVCAQAHHHHHSSRCYRFCCWCCRCHCSVYVHVTLKCDTNDGHRYEPIQACRLISTQKMYIIPLLLLLLSSSSASPLFGRCTHNNEVGKFVRQINILITFEFIFGDESEKDLWIGRHNLFWSNESWVRASANDEKIENEWSDCFLLFHIFSTIYDLAVYLAHSLWNSSKGDAADKHKNEDGNEKMQAE